MLMTIFIILLVLWLLGIRLNWPVFLGIFLFFILSAIVTYRLIMPAYHRRTSTGKEGLIGLEGKVVEKLDPRGLIKVNGEIWKAATTENTIETGEKVEVIGYTGMLLKVKRLATPASKGYHSGDTTNI